MDSLTSNKYDVEDLSGIPDLIEVIKLQATGPTEVARALRKKLKYGTVHSQLRALVLLNALLENGGPKLRSRVWDEPLLERLRVCGSSVLYDQRVRDKCTLLFATWRHAYLKEPDMADLANLYKMLPRRPREVTKDTSMVLKETERDPFEDDEDNAGTPPIPQKPTAGGSQGSQSSPAGPSDSQKKKSSISNSFFGSSERVSSKGKTLTEKKARKFDQAKERETMQRKIADSHVQSALLIDILRRINRQEERISENPEAIAQVAKVKRLRQYLRRYITHVTTDELLGPLLAAHDALINALLTFEQLDRSVDADSDSDDELAEQQHAYRSKYQVISAPSESSNCYSDGREGSRGKKETAGGWLCYDRHGRPQHRSYRSTLSPTKTTSVQAVP